MNCIKCGVLLAEDAKFCEACGAPVEEVATEVQQEVKEEGIVEQTKEKVMSVLQEKKMDKKQLITFVLGTILIIVGFARIFSAGTTISPTSFGADFYTYTYRGIVAISELLAAIEVSLGWIIVAIGVAIDVKAFRK